MSILSNEFFLLGNIIYSKKMNRGFVLPQDTLERLMLSEKNNIFSYLSDKEKEYLSEKGILLYSDKKINAICVETDMNECRLFIQLTNKCNLHCKHCFVESDMQKRDYFSYDNAVKMIDCAISHGINRIDFTGGEVFTQSYFMDLLKYLDCQPVGYSFFTNLTITNAKVLSDLAELKGLMCVITSLDYFDKDRHNTFRGSNMAYQTTLKNIKWLKEHGVKVIVNIMVMDDNHDDIERMMGYFLDNGIEVHFDTVIECGRAKCNTFNNQSVDKNIRFINELLIKLAKQGVVVDHLSGSCGVSKTLVFVHYSGEFMLCPGLTKDVSEKYALGFDMKDAWEKAKMINIGCSDKTCEQWESCSHGCRLRALVDNGSDMAPDSMMCRLLRGNGNGNKFS